MKPYTRSIIELFDGKRRYMIPLYQRHYAWKVRPQLELLWEDIERSTMRLAEDRSNLNPHFMGAIVLSQVKTFGKQVQAFEVIDGQQRLTTFQLLLAAFRDVAKAHSSRYEMELEKYLLNDGVMEDSDVERFKLWPSTTDRHAFIHVVKSDAENEMTAPGPNEEDGMVKPSVAAHEYFKSKVEGHVTIDGTFDEHRLELLFESLKAGLAVVSIELEGGDDPQTIFETLNSRGVDLTPGDLMRNVIFQRAKGMGQLSHSLVVDQLYEKHWLPLDGGFWGQTASRGRQSGQRLDWMLTDHLSMHVGRIVSSSKLFEDYRRWILNEKPFESVVAELESISATARIERRLFEQVNGDPVGHFGRFADAFDVSTAMPLVVYLATDYNFANSISRALQILISYILRRDVCGLTTKNYNRFFVGIIDRLRSAENDKVGILLDYLSSRKTDTDRWPDDDEFGAAWQTRAQYQPSRQPRLRYIFEAIETAKRNPLTEDIEIKSILTIEHIMPRKWQENWPINGAEEGDELNIESDYFVKEMFRNRLVNTLGNLTLLTQPLNSSVSNGPYSVKMPAIRAHSSLALNRELNGIDEWNDEAIIARGKSLFRRAAKIWEAPIRSSL